MKTAFMFLQCKAAADSLLLVLTPPWTCVSVPAVIVDLLDIHHGSATGQSVVCITRGQPTPLVEWFVCKNIKR